MMPVSVLVPWRPSCPDRVLVWDWVRAWWAVNHPTWQLVEGTHLDGPWCKARAVADALTRADGDVLVIADADVICHGVGDAVNALASGAPWATPHRAVHRLTGYATAEVLAGGPLPDVTARRADQHGIREVHSGVAGGGLTVLPRHTYERVPLDPRFVGWGQEDTSWAYALLVMCGQGWRGTAPLLHLWHPPQDRMSRTVGSREGLTLHRRYRHTSTQARMAALLAEIPQLVC